MSAPQRVPDLRHPHPEPRSYPLILRTWDYQWWRPAVGLIAVLVGMFVVAPLVLLPVLAVAVGLEGHADFAQAVQDAAGLKTVTPAAMLYLNLTLASVTLVVWAVLRWLHRMRPRWAASVRPGFRWRFFAVCLGLALVALVAQLAVGAVLPSDPNDLGGDLNKVTGTWVALAVIILLTTPLQAIGEEYAFRGYAIQAFGALTRHPWIAVLISSLLFAAAHGVQNAPLFLDRFLFGLMAGYVVVRTGGLEAGIAMHIWNNLVAFGLALAIGDISASLKVSEISWWNVPLTVTQNGVYLILVLWAAKRMGLSDKTTPPSQGDPRLVAAGPVV